MKREKCAVYIRVSTSSLDQLNSFKNQRQYFEEYISSKEEFSMYKLYADKGLTATTFKNRKQFYAMLYDAGIDIKTVTVNGRKKDAYFASDRKPKFTYIFCKNTSRFARNILSIDIIRELRTKGVYVYYMGINKSTKDMSDDFLISLLSLLDEQESKDKSQKVMFGQKISAQNGIINTSNRIYGYKLIKGTTPSGNRLEAIPEEAEVIRLIFNMYEKGSGIREIESVLEKNGIKTRENKQFLRSSIRRILQNEKYMGILVRNKYYSGTVLVDKHYPKLKPESEWIFHEDANIEPIISKEQFYKCKEIRESKINYYNNKGKNNGRTKYAGLIRCAKCGMNYIRNSDRGKPFYNCSNKKRYGGKKCNNANISEVEFERKIQDYINSKNKSNEVIIQYIDFLEIYIEWLTEKMDMDTDSVVNKKNNEIIKLEEKMERTKELYTDGDIDKDEYVDKRDVLVEKIKTLRYEVDNIDKHNAEFRDEIIKSKEIISDLKKFNIKSIDNEDDFFDNINFISIEDKELKFEFALKKEQKDFIDKALIVMGS